MGPEGIILNPPITTFQQSLTHSALKRDPLVLALSSCPFAGPGPTNLHRIQLTRGQLKTHSL